MSLRPYILEPGCLCDERVEIIVTAGLLDLGCITRRGYIDREEVKAAEKAVPLTAKLWWRRLMALEWLLAESVNAKDVATGLSSFAGETLALDQDATEPTAHQLADSDATIALAPLASQGGTQPGVAALIVSRAKVSSVPVGDPVWETLQTFRYLQGCRLDTLKTPHPVSRIDGVSWQLSAALADRALRAGDAQTRLALACDWLPTGSIRDDGSIEVIEFGNKGDLSVFMNTGSKRHWLAPTQAQLPGSIKQAIFQAQTLDIAWNHIARQGTVEEHTRRDWPAGIEAMHSFVSSAREPVIAAAILAHPQKLVLWRTDNEIVSWKPAEDIRYILRAVRPEIEVIFRDIPSNSMHAVENVLKTAMGTALREGCLTLFNVTQGNRLMGFAAHTMARRYPSLWLLYRDNDDQGIDFTAIRYDGRDYPVTFTLTADPATHPDIRWSKLLRSSSPRKLTDRKTLLHEIRMEETNGIVQKIV